VAAYVSNNHVSASGLPAIISTVYAALGNTVDPQSAAPDSVEQKPAVPIKRSVTPDAILCLECGKRHKMLKRHLRAEHDLTPAQYRAKWNLPPEYPMTAPAYAEQRSTFAKTIGLGRSGRGKGRKRAA